MTIRRGRLLALALAALLAFPAAAQARSADIVDAHVGLRLAKDSSLLVSERLGFDYQGHFEGSYRDIVLRHGERIGDIKVSEGGKAYEPGGNTALGSNDAPGVFGATSMPDGVRIVWHYRATDEKRTFEISYRVFDAAVAYDDVIDVPWAVWGDQWKFGLPHLGADLTDRALDPANSAYRVWGHPRSVEGRTVRGRGVATLEASDIFDKTAVEMRVTVPRAPGRDVSGARHGAGAGLAKILAEEKGLDKDFNTPFQRAKRWLAHHALLLALILAALALLAMAAMRILARERPTSTPKYLSGPPDDAPPALAYGLAHEGDESNDTVLATLLDLVDRGYYDDKQATTETEELDIAISKAAKRPTAKLEPYEKKVLDFFDELIGDDSVAMSEMSDRIPEHDEGWRSRWNEMTTALDAADDGQLEWDRDYTGWQFLLGFAVIVCFGLVAWADIAVDHRGFGPIAIGVGTLLVVLFAGGNSVRRLAPEYRERSARWQAFSRWTADFPRLDDDPPATLDLWKRILVFGVAFGTADRMIASGRIPAPVLESAGNSGWAYLALNNQLAMSSFTGASFSSGFASQVAPESSGGGGGFSGGGGGGFSGGGGGGSW
ncbi:MAG: hypothetical protein QOJ38_1560 [Solirubrobacterales bacterium]|nr:hypothetical protein [Solirubrobacterales bacterium]